jgi:hypothetical protein
MRTSYMQYFETSRDSQKRAFARKMTKQSQFAVTNNEASHYKEFYEFKCG